MTHYDYDTGLCVIQALVVMKVTDIPQTTRDEEEDEEDSDDEQPPAQLEHQTVKHYGAVNRVSVCPHNSAIVSTWSDTGQVCQPSL